MFLEQLGILDSFVIAIILFVLVLSVLYVISAFIVSLKRLLPFLALATSIVTLILLKGYMDGDGLYDHIWILTFLTVAMRLFTYGEGFMEVKIVSNMYNLVSVERKWKSLFAEDDEYILHFSPQEVGGFYENAIFSSIAFYMFYYFFSSDVVYALAIYYLALAVIDILIIVTNANISQGLYSLSKFFVIIGVAIYCLVVFISSFGVGVPTAKVNKCKSITDLDYSTSYQVEYKMGYQQKLNVNWTREAYFVYDADLNIGADYYETSGGNVYTSLYIKEPNLNNKVVEIVSTGDSKFAFGNYAQSYNGGFKYLSFDEPSLGWDSLIDNEEIEKYCKLSNNKLKSDLTIYEGQNVFSITYHTVLDKNYSSENDDHYTVIFRYIADDKGNPVQLEYISLQYMYGTGNVEHYKYTPIYGATELVDFIAGDGSIIGYAYNDSTLFGYDINELLGNSSSNDFTFSVKSNEDLVNYCYDAESGKTAIFINNSEAAQNAESSSDFITYRPDKVVSNNEQKLLNSEFEVIGQYPINFYNYTYDDPALTNIINNIFAIHYDHSIKGEHTENVFVYIGSYSFTAYNEQLNTDVYYSFLFYVDQNRDYSLNSFYASFEKDGKTYACTFGPSVDFDIVLP